MKLNNICEFVKYIYNLFKRSIYDEEFSKNKISVISKLYLHSIICGILMDLSFYLINKTSEKKIYFIFGRSSPIKRFIVAPIFEEFACRYGILLMKLYDDDDEFKKSLGSLKIFILPFKISFYGFSLIGFPYLHFRNFNSDKLSIFTSSLFTMTYYGIPTLYLTYLSHKYSLSRSIILHSFINMSRSYQFFL